MNEITVVDTQLQLPLPDGVRFTNRALELPQDLTYEGWMDVGRFLARSEESLDFWVADWVRAGRDKFGADKVRDALAELELKIQNLRRSQLLESLGFRDSALNTAHHYVLARSKLDDVGVKMWADLSKKENLSAAELQESIKKGHVVRIKQEPHDGPAGVSTWQGLSMQFDLMRRQVGDEWKNWSVEQIDVVLGKLDKISDFIDDLWDLRKEKNATSAPPAIPPPKDK